MGKDKKRKRSKSRSSAKSEHSRSRSHHKQSNNKQSKSPQHKNLKKSYQITQQLIKYKHFYYLINQNKHISQSHAIWHIITQITTRPQKILIICQSLSQITSFRNAYRLCRSISLIDDNIQIQQLTKIIENQPEILMMTVKKCSMMLALASLENVFEVIVNTSKCYDVEFYSRIIELVEEGGTLVTYSELSKLIKKLSDQLKIEIQQLHPTITQLDQNRELLSSIQFSPKPSLETFHLLSNLPFSPEETAARLYSLFHTKNSKPSVHLNMFGYTTYKLEFEIQFSSMKYVWNFFKEELSNNLCEQIRGVQKYENEKGVVFNVPWEIKHILDDFVEKIRRSRSRYKGVVMEQIIVLPKLEDTESEQYKKMKQKKTYAMQHRNQLQIYIGGLPYDVNQKQIRQFFKTNHVNLLLIRILKEKGIAFVLCEDKQHFQRGLLLNNSQYGQRFLRIKVADHR